MSNDAKRRGYRPISDYALIGDCHTAALISKEGSIDWYCPRRFDAPAVFCRILDARKGGYLRIVPAGPHEASRRYRNSTNMLETTFRTAKGSARVTDFMPVYQRKAGHRGDDTGNHWRIIRLVEGLSGEVDLSVEFKPTFNYARDETQVDLVSGKGVIAHAGQKYLTLSFPDSNFDTTGDGAKRSTVKLRDGDRHWVVLTDAENPDDAKRALDPGGFDDQFKSTEQYWRSWAARCTFRGAYSDEVLRSVLTLKMLTYEPTGAVVAAPTTSLPENVGGVRNWDYRYTWIRDSSLILYALMTTGFQDEATDFIHWLEETQHKDPTSAPQIMYALDGTRKLTEEKLDNLDGYMHSRPVRVGNAAYDQFQLDVYGELLTAAYLHFQAPTHGRKHIDERSDGHSRPGTKGHKPSAKAWNLLKFLVGEAEQLWQEPDNGIWEVRGGRQKFLYSRVMCWAAMDRGIRLSQEYGLDAPVQQWTTTRENIKHAILTQGYNEKIGAFTQAFGSSALDASALIIPRVGLLPPTDPRVRSTVKKIKEELTHDGLVFRYRTEDGLPGGEGTFSLCSFWLVDALTLGGDLDDAQDLFNRITGYANDVGLLSEEIDASTGHLLGNFPQGFSHLALVRSAVDLAKASKHGPEEQPENEAQRAGKARQAAKQAYSGKTDKTQQQRRAG